LPNLDSRHNTEAYAPFYTCDAVLTELAFIINDPILALNDMLTDRRRILGKAHGSAVAGLALAGVALAEDNRARSKEKLKLGFR